MEIKCTLTGCNRRFTTKKSLRAHLRGHSGEKIFACTFSGCVFAYCTNQHLNRHIKRVHEKTEGAFKCDSPGCLASFDKTQGLVQHKNRCHGGYSKSPKTLKCCHCSKEFLKKWQVKEHEASHTGGNAFSCETCSEEFRDYLTFRRHRKSHVSVPKTHSCSVCNEVFSKWTEFRRHKAKHARDFAPLECSLCGKTFSTRSNLNVHNKTHTVPTVFACPHKNCGRTYNHMKNLTQHIRSNHESEKFSCQLCEKKLSSKQKLAQHIERMHRNPDPKTKRGKRWLREALEKKFVGDPSKLDLDFVQPNRSGKRRVRRDFLKEHEESSKPPMTTLLEDKDNTEVKVTFENGGNKDSDLCEKDSTRFQQLSATLVVDSPMISNTNVLPTFGANDEETNNAFVFKDLKPVDF